ncbi:MAG TPA: carboxypeptidase regulatory-like domain-containing protein [Verrucomicrobiae bacterium]|nr:carboxypeptidase regulatory-like domain-containing protein [Verrucomicrobiae bacterium]
MKQSVRSVGFIFALLSLLALSAVMAFGQAIDGNVVGTVVDSSGAAVVGADVTATNVATNVVATTKTNGTGEYRFNHLPVGTYRINVKMTGFKSVTEQVDVQLNLTATRNLTLQPGAATETIEVSGTPPAIDTTTSQLQNTYENQLLQDLPTATTGTGVLNASLLDAGVGSTGGLGAGAGPSVGGQRPRENNFTIEGTDNNDKGVTGPLVYVPNDAVANFTVIENQFSPEFGHSAGGQFNQVIMSGTNTIHGRVYEYFKNRNLDALDQEFANQGVFTNPRYDNNRFGGQVGGAIIKNKWFYFVNFEYNPIGEAATPSSAALAPTAAGWTQLLGIGDPTISANNANGFAQYATGTVAASNLTSGQDPLCTSIAAVPNTVVVQNYSTTVTCTATATQVPTPNFIPVQIVPIVAPAYTNNRALVTSMDYDMSDRDQIRGRYIYNKTATIDTGAELPIFYTPLTEPYHLVTLGEYHTFSPSIGNEFRVGFNRTGFNLTVPAGSLGTFENLDAFPNLTIDELGSINVGPDPNAPQYETENTYQLEDNLSIVKGNHTLKFGADLRKQIDPQKFIQRSRGDYEWTDLDSFVHDQVPSFGQRSFGSVGYSGDDKMYGWYVNDIWKIRPNVSLNLGVRYEYLTVPFGWTQQSLNAVADDPGLITFGSPQAPKHDFMPRIGIAYSPGTSGNTSIRAGFSMGYDVLYDNIGTLSRPPQIGSTANCPSSVCQNPFLENGGIPPEQSSGITTLDQADARANTSSYLPVNVKYPYAESWSVGVQHVFKEYTAEVRYVGSRGVHLPLQDILNFYSYVTPTNSLPTYLSAPTQAQLDALPLTLDGPGGLLDQSYNCVTTCYVGEPWLDAGFYSPITSFEPWGSSNYSGLQTEVQRRLTNGLQFQAAWTWSHTIDNSTADFHSTDITPRRPQDFHNLAAERGNSLLDHAHRITLEMSYDVPWFAHDSNWFRKNLLGNYQFIPIYTWESGQWGTVQSADDANLNADSAPDRAILNPAGVKGTGSDVTPLTNTAGYTVAYLADNPNAQYITASYGAYATSSRSNLQTPPINNFDISAAKHFKFGERYTVDFMAQAFNLFNHPQFVTGYINDVASLGVTGAARNNFIPASTIFNTPRQNFSSSPRTMQLALKFSF